MAYVAAMDARAKKDKEKWLQNQEKRLQKHPGSKEKDYKGKPFNHPLASEACGMACEAIRSMVYKLAMGYAVSCKEDVDDLAQDCFKRISECMGDYNPKMGCFTTWAWRVCVSVLNRTYRRESARNKNVVLTDMSSMRGRYEPRTDFDLSPIVRNEMIQAVRDLMDENPGRRTLISEMFGGSLEKGLLSTKMMLHRAAKRTGVAYFKVEDFFELVVRPFFMSRFEYAV